MRVFDGGNGCAVVVSVRNGCAAVSLIIGLCEIVVATVLLRFEFV